jgi:hypothetical protein
MMRPCRCFAIGMAKKRAGQIHIGDAAPFVERHIGEQLWRRYAGVIEQDISAAEFRDHAVAGGLDCPLVGDVSLDDKRTAPAGMDSVSRLIKLAPIAADKREIGAGIR